MKNNLFFLRILLPCLFSFQILFLYVVSSAERISLGVWWSLALSLCLIGVVCDEGEEDRVASDLFYSILLLSVCGSLFFLLPEKNHPVSCLRILFMCVRLYLAAYTFEIEQEWPDGPSYVKSRLSWNFLIFTICLALVLWWIHLPEFVISLV